MYKKLIAGLLLIGLFACKDEGVSPTGVPTGSFEEVIAAGGDFAPVTESNEIVDETLEDEMRDEELWRCTTQTYEANYGGGGDEGFPQFNPNASVVYPGNLLQGKTLQNATPSVIAVERAGGTVSIDIYDGSGTSYFEVEKVTKSAIGQAANNIIAGSTGAIPANLDFSYETVYSREQLAVSLGVDYNTAFSSVEANLSFSSDREYNRTIVKLNQSYYTLSFDLPTSYESLFAEGVTPADLARYVAPDNPVTYISDVTYGRIYYLLVETTSSVEEMEAAVTASFSGVAAGGGVDAEVEKLSSLSNMKVKLFAFGGEASSTLMTIQDPGNLYQLAELLAEGTDIRTGKPMSYVVRSAHSNEIVSVALNTRYDVTNCIPLNPNGPPPGHTAHWAGLYKDFGAIGAACSVDGGTNFYLFNEEGKKYMYSHDGKLDGPFSINKLADEPCPLDDIGAAAYVEGSSTSGTIMLFDKSGLKYCYLFTDSRKFTDPEPIGNFGVGDFAFNLKGVGAMLNYGVEEDPNLANYYTNLRVLFEKNGDRYVLYHNRSANTFDWPQHIDNFVLNKDFPFEGSVSAAAGFKVGNDRYHLLFNEEGTKYVIAVRDSFHHYYEGPFGL